MLDNLEDINSQFNKELQQQIDGVLPKEHTYSLGSGKKLIAWINKEKALNFISTQSTNLIAGGNKTQGSTINIVKNFENVK